VPEGLISTPSSDVARPKTAILRVQGPDRKGIVAAFAQVLYGQ
jgi:glycine cleavage system regulatory protein